MASPCFSFFYSIPSKQSLGFFPFSPVILILISCGDRSGHLSGVVQTGHDDDSLNCLNAISH